MTTIRSHVIHLFVFLALTVGLGGLVIGGASQAEAGGGVSEGETFTLDDGGQFLFWSFGSTTASSVFSSVVIAWLFNAAAVDWTSYIPPLGVTDFGLVDGGVLWVVSEGAQTIAVGGGAPPDDDPAEVELAEAIADALIDDLGEEDATAALLFAFERGYTADQIEDGAFAGSLNADGTIDGIAPASEPLGLILLPDAGTAGVRAAGEPGLVSAISAAIARSGDPLLLILLLILYSGYTPDQLVLAILLGGDLVRFDEVDFCIGLHDDTGRLIRPSQDFSSPCARFLGVTVDDEEAEAGMEEDVVEEDDNGEPPPSADGDDGPHADLIADCIARGGTPSDHTDGTFDGGIGTCLLPGSGII